MQKNSGFLNHQISALASGRVANNIKECLNLFNWAKFLVNDHHFLLPSQNWGKNQKKKSLEKKSIENFNISENNMILVLKLPRYYDGIYTCKHTFLWLIFAIFRPQKID